MTFLLDTQVLLWWLLDDGRLARPARAAIADSTNVVYASAASAWEIAIKSSLGRLSLPRAAEEWFPEEMERNRFLELPIRSAHALGVRKLPRHHEDPFDRLLVAQARAESLTLITSDRMIERYDVHVLKT